MMNVGKQQLRESYFYGIVQGPEKMNDTYVKTVHTG
jgi:hypothetical protein